MLKKRSLPYAFAFCLAAAAPVAAEDVTPEQAQEILARAPLAIEWLRNQIERVDADNGFIAHNPRQKPTCFSVANDALVWVLLAEEIDKPLALNILEKVPADMKDGVPFPEKAMNNKAVYYAGLEDFLKAYPAGVFPDNWDRDYLIGCFSTAAEGAAIRNTLNATVLKDTASWIETRECAARAALSENAAPEGP